MKKVYKNRNEFFKDLVNEPDFVKITCPIHFTDGGDLREHDELFLYYPSFSLEQAIKIRQFLPDTIGVHLTFENNKANK